MPVDRRELIQILGAGIAAAPTAAAQHVHRPGAKAWESYAPRALTSAEYANVDRLSDILLPADESSPGAHDAGVARYIDIVLLYGDKTVLSQWKAGLEAVNALAKSKYGREFDQLTRSDQTGALEALARNESHPETDAEKFFVALKRLAIEAYYMSAAGEQSLGYKGNTAVASFPGCAHPAHTGGNSA